MGVAHTKRCSHCNLAIDYVSSDIGRSVVCKNCSSKFELTVPDEVEDRFKRSEAVAKALADKWAHHDHISDPKPFEDPNGFFHQLIKFTEGKSALSQKIAGAGIHTIPPTEDYLLTLAKLREVTHKDLEPLPEKARNAFIELRTAINKYCNDYFMKPSVWYVLKRYIFDLWGLIAHR